VHADRQQHIPLDQLAVVRTLGTFLLLGGGIAKVIGGAVITLGGPGGVGTPDKISALAFSPFVRSWSII